MNTMLSIFKLLISGIKQLAALAGKLLKIFGYSVLFVITATASVLLRMKHKKETSKA